MYNNMDFEYKYKYLIYNNNKNTFYWYLPCLPFLEYNDVTTRQCEIVMRRILYYVGEKLSTL